MSSDPDNLISYPKSDSTPEPVQVSSSSAVSSTSRQVLNDRIYVGNLHPTVDEYSLLQLFSKYGRITKLDFLFHKSGPLKGKPRGYAFVEYGDKDEAQKALASAHDKLFRGRKLVVTFAQQAPLDIGASSSRLRKNVMDSGRPTTLSLLKSGVTAHNAKHHDPTSNKIAMMEAKLRQMEASKELPSASTSSSLPTHPSLPSKPPPMDPNAKPPRAPTNNKPPVLAPPNPEPHGLRLAPPTKPVAASKPKASGLLGVKIVKKKDKPADAT
ncbi:hypothetical protein AAF712_001563 [Marasmius tenuissimus]|uniref:Probable RNA-binding protein 18 n=1 Tax=Marasmius tenuissimus TaxID=585030 RepID=A0ABR3ABY3_9AGAR|nr:hypothetical protein PM082_008362 [Marasmius tenuissimus]